MLKHHELLSTPHSPLAYVRPSGDGRQRDGDEREREGDERMEERSRGREGDERMKERSRGRQKAVISDLPVSPRLFCSLWRGVRGLELCEASVPLTCECGPCMCV